MTGVEKVEEEESVISLISHLSAHYAGLGSPTRRDGISNYIFSRDSKVEHDRLTKRYKRIAFEFILKKKLILKSQLGYTSCIDALYGKGLKLSIQGDTVGSGKLIKLADSLDITQPTLDPVLRCLLALAGSGPRPKMISSGFRQIGDCALQITGERCSNPYSDSFNFSGQDRDKTIKSSSTAPYPTNFNFELSPASGSLYPQPSEGMKSMRNLHAPSSAAHTHEIHSNAEICSEVGDEGYSSPCPIQENDDVWERVWKEKSPEKLSWETFGGKGQGSEEKPFLSEAGPTSVHHLWQMCNDNLRLLYPSYAPPVLHVIEEKTLCTHIAYILAGIETASFSTNPDTGRFCILPGLCIEGLTPESVSSATQQYLEAGDIYKSLTAFVKNQESSSRILAGFTTGVSRYLRLYSNSVIFIGAKLHNLGKLHLALRPLLHQIQLLGSICRVKEDPSGCMELPTGVELLSLLLEVSLHVSDDQSNLTLVSLFKSAVNPYFRFLKSWLYSGECDYSFKEFGILMDTRYLSNRTQEFWNNMYGLTPLSEQGSGASFLAEIQEKVFSTGKSLSLLRLVSPDHHLSGRFRDIQPDFILAVTARDQSRLRLSVEEYTCKLTEAARLTTFSLTEKREKEKEDRIQEAKMVKIRHEEDSEKIRKEMEKRKEEKKSAQQKIYKELVKHAEETKSHREKERRKVLEEEAEIEREAERRAEEERKREEEDRIRITEFYTRLQREAEVRERRAEWRLKRNNPGIKSKRILLHRTLATSLENRMKIVGISKPLEPIHAQMSLDGLSDLEILKDEMGNFTVRFKDSEGNILIESLDFFQPFDSELQNQIGSKPFSDLSDHLKTKIIHGLEFRLLQKQLPTPEPIESTPTLSRRRENNPTTISDYLTQGEIEFPDKNGNLEETYDTPDTVGERKKPAAVPIERLLYPQRFNQEKVVETKIVRTEIVLRKSSKPLPYTKAFPELKLPPKPDQVEPLKELETKTFPPLGLILQNSVLVPLRAQKKLVDSALLNHMLVQAQLEEHLQALRRYLLLADGEFGRQLVLSLCYLGREIREPGELAGEIREHIHYGASPPLILCPTSLNRVLETALSASLLGTGDTFSRNLSFGLSANPDQNLGIPGLSLRYRAPWPANILLSEDVLKKYSTVLDFMLNLRTCLAGLEQDWSNENLGRREERRTRNYTHHRINIIRHEMLNFIRNLHSYVASQVLDVSWLEFQVNLTSKVTCLDELIRFHTKYINRVVFRCLLNQKAAPLMKIINSIFISINKFSSYGSARLGRVEEEEMLKQYQTFQKTSRFLFDLVTKLCSRGYEPHFQDLLLRLNFNGFYNSSLEPVRH